MTITIREARLSDAGTIKDLVMALAEYHGGSDKCMMTVELVERNLFEKKYAYCVLAIDNDTSEAVGLALYFYNYSTWTARPGIYLEDLYVKEAYRGGGIGKMFFGYLAQVAKKLNCGRLDLSVHKDNTTSKQFYENLGGDVLNTWQTIRFQDEALINLCRLYTDSNDHSSSSKKPSSNGYAKDGN